MWSFASSLIILPSNDKYPLHMSTISYVSPKYLLIAEFLIFSSIAYFIDASKILLVSALQSPSISFKISLLPLRFSLPRNNMFITMTSCDLILDPHQLKISHRLWHFTLPLFCICIFFHHKSNNWTNTCGLFV